jgi:hypothetical protein
MILPLLLLAAPLQGVTPSDFDARVIELSTSSDGVDWFPVFFDPSGVSVDLGNQLPLDVASETAPVTEWHHVRVALETEIMVQAVDPCGSGQTIYHDIDLTGDAVHDPDGDGIWVLHFTTLENGGSVAGDGSVLNPKLLPDPIKPPKGRETRIRVLIRTTNIVRCENGVVVVDTPDIRVVCDDGEPLSKPLANQKFQISGLLADHTDALPSVTTMQGIWTFDENGSWAASDGFQNTLNVTTAQGTAQDFNSLRGLWGTRKDGKVWMTMEGLPGLLVGNLGGWDETIAMTSFENEGISFTVFGNHWPQSAPADPFQQPTRFLHYGARLDVLETSPFDGDLIWHDAFGRLSGSGGWLGFDGPVIVNELRWLRVFDPAPHQIVTDSDPLPMTEGAPFDVLTTGGEMNINLVDWNQQHHGSVISDGRFTLASPSDPTDLAHGISMTLGIPWDTNPSAISGATLHGTYFSDMLVEGGTLPSAGRFSVSFASDGTVQWKQEQIVDGQMGTQEFTGTWTMDPEAMVVIDLPGVGRWRGQLSNSPRILGLVSSPDGTNGFDDRFIGLLLWH